MTTTQSSTKFQVVHVKLSESDECEAKRLSKIIFPYLQMMSGDLENFLESHGLLTKKNKIVKDAQGFLYAIKKRQNLPNFLNAKGKNKKTVERIILEAIKGRNAICHSNLPEVLNHWRVYLNSWINVYLMTGGNRTASEMKRVRRFLSSSARKMPAGLNPTVSAMKIFTNLANRSSLTSWTQQKQEAYHFLGDVFYDLITDSYSLALEEFAITRNYQCATSVIDCHEFTKLIKSKCTAHDFASPQDSTCFNLSNLKIAADGRHAAVHEQKIKLLSNWQKYLDSMICVMKGIGAMAAAKTIGRARSHLVRARDRARTSVLHSRQQPAATIGQPVGTQQKITKTCQRKKHNRNRNTGNRHR